MTPSVFTTLPTSPTSFDASQLIVKARSSFRALVEKICDLVVSVFEKIAEWVKKVLKGAPPPLELSLIPNMVDPAYARHLKNDAALLGSMIEKLDKINIKILEMARRSDNPDRFKAILACIVAFHLATPPASAYAPIPAFATKPNHVCKQIVDLRNSWQSTDTHGYPPGELLTMLLIFSAVPAENLSNEHALPEHMRKLLRDTLALANHFWVHSNVAFEECACLIAYDLSQSQNEAAPLSLPDRDLIDLLSR